MSLSKQGDSRPSLFRNGSGGFLSQLVRQRRCGDESHAMEEQEED